MVRPSKRPPTAKSFHSQETDHQHDNLLQFLVDDRFFKGKEPMRQKRAITESLLHKVPFSRILTLICAISTLFTRHFNAVLTRFPIAQDP